MSGPSGTPAPTGCVYLGAPVFGKLPIWTQQSRCTITGQRTAARYAGAAVGMGVQAIRCGTFLYRGWNRTREIQKPLVFGGVLFHISFAVERNMATGGIKAGRGCSPQSENGKRAVGDAGPYGGIDESAPVFEGAPMRAVGDAGPYGVRDRRHGEIRVGGVCPLGAVKRGTRERVAFSGRL